MKSLLLAAAVALVACSARAKEVPKDEGFGSLSVDQVATLLAKHDADVFDNNAKEDWQKGHVPGARWVAFNGVKASDLPQDLSRKLVFYCANEH
jgi:rhodanese-related sulfurtransferase